MWLNYGLLVLYKVVSNPHNTDYAIKWTTSAEMEESSDLLQKNIKHGPLLHGVFGLTDGERMRCVKYIEKGLQKAY